MRTREALPQLRPVHFKTQHGDFLKQKFLDKRCGVFGPGYLGQGAFLLSNKRGSAPGENFFRRAPGRGDIVNSGRARVSRIRLRRRRGEENLRCLARVCFVPAGKTITWYVDAEKNVPFAPKNVKFIAGGLLLRFTVLNYFYMEHLEAKEESAWRSVRNG